LEFGRLNDLVEQGVLLLAFSHKVFNQLVSLGFFLDESFKSVFRDLFCLPE
jgi:hypothetical protein